MTEPLHHLGYAFHPRPVRQRRSLDHDDGKLQFACGIDLGTRAVSPELRATIHSIRRERIRSSSPASVNGPRETIRSASGNDSEPPAASMNRSV